jgi:hypothetical protein
MKPFLSMMTLSIVLCSIIHADVPEKKPLQYYSGLWLNSPFTTKPEIINNTPAINPFDDYHLTGIAPIKGGYRITITHKKTKDKIVIEPGRESVFQVLNVDRNPEISLGTVVTLTNGSSQGIVRFEPNLVVLNIPTTTNKAEQFPPGMNPNQPNNGQAAPNTGTRSRIVPPVKPSNNNPQSQSQSQSQSRSRRTK